LGQQLEHKLEHKLGQQPPHILGHRLEQQLGHKLGHMLGLGQRHILEHRLGPLDGHKMERMLELLGWLRILGRTLVGPLVVGHIRQHKLVRLPFHILAHRLGRPLVERILACKLGQRAFHILGRMGLGPLALALGQQRRTLVRTGRRGRTPWVGHIRARTVALGRMELA